MAHKEKPLSKLLEEVDPHDLHFNERSTCVSSGEFEKMQKIAICLAKSCESVKMDLQADSLSWEELENTLTTAKKMLDK